jgi:hypothetical protein
MTSTDQQLKIINVLNPLQCLRCVNAHVANVLFTDGGTKKMFHCSRLDCDNWCTDGMQDCEGVLRTEDSEAA